MPLPRAPHGDLTIRLARDPYRLIGRVAARLGTDAFRGRLMLRETLFLSGAEQARSFYTSDLSRNGAMPVFLQVTLFGRGGVQGLDGAEHRRRKAMFLSILTRDAPGILAARLTSALDDLAASRPRRIVVQDEMARILTRITCDWAGIPLPEDELSRRAAQLSHLFDHALPTTPKYLLALADRRRTNAWAGSLISAARRGDLRPPQGSALETVASYRDTSGHPLGGDVAAVELLNVVRPIVAVSVWLTFIAHAVATQVGALRAAADRPDGLVQEVRRFYPFFPVVAAVAPRDMAVGSEEVAAGTRVLLDLYGTNRDAARWRDPGMFRPARFDGREIDPFELVPQGGGDFETGHRCAGEWISLALMRSFADWMTRIDCERTPQDLDLAMQELPGLPASRMVWENLRPVAQTP